MHIGKRTEKTQRTDSRPLISLDRLTSAVSAIQGRGDIATIGGVARELGVSHSAATTWLNRNLDESAKSWANFGVIPDKGLPPPHPLRVELNKLLKKYSSPFQRAYVAALIINLADKRPGERPKLLKKTALAIAYGVLVGDVVRCEVVAADILGSEGYKSLRQQFFPQTSQQRPKGGFFSDLDKQIHKLLKAEATKDTALTPVANLIGDLEQARRYYCRSNSFQMLFSLETENPRIFEYLDSVAEKIFITGDMKLTKSQRKVLKLYLEQLVDGTFVGLEGLREATGMSRGGVQLALAGRKTHKGALQKFAGSLLHNDGIPAEALRAAQRAPRVKPSVKEAAVLLRFFNLEKTDSQISFTANEARAFKRWLELKKSGLPVTRETLAKALVIKIGTLRLTLDRNRKSLGLIRKMNRALADDKSSILDERIVESSMLEPGKTKIFAQLGKILSNPTLPQPLRLRIEGALIKVISQTRFRPVRIFVQPLASYVELGDENARHILREYLSGNYKSLHETLRYSELSFHLPGSEQTSVMVLPSDENILCIFKAFSDRSFGITKRRGAFAIVLSELTARRASIEAVAQAGERPRIVGEQGASVNSDIEQLLSYQSARPIELLTFLRTRITGN